MFASAVIDFTAEFLLACWHVLCQMAPYLLLGFFGAGLLSILLSPRLVERLVGKPGIGSILKSAGLGVPLPLCSCSVIPVSMALRRHGASPGATTAFLLSTPQTGVDSIAVTYGLLGWPLAVFRAVFALITGVIGGFATDLAVKDPDRTDKDEAAECDDCRTPGGESRLRRLFRYTFVTMPGDLGGPLLIGVLISGFLTVVVPAGELQQYLGSGILGIVAMLAISVPLYVCATASVPIAVGLIHMGASPGAALAFLIAGPATNSATVLAVLKVLGKKAMAVYLITVALAALAAGLLFDGLFAGVSESDHAGHVHPGLETPSWFAGGCAVLLLFLIVVMNPRVRRLIGRGSAAKAPASPSVGGETLVLRVTGMTCAHCEQTVDSALRSCRGVSRVDVDRVKETALVEGGELDSAELVRAVAKSGFDATIDNR